MLRNIYHYPNMDSSHSQNPQYFMNKYRAIEISPLYFSEYQEVLIYQYIHIQ